MHVAGRCSRKWRSGSHAAAHELSQQEERGHCIVDRVTVRPTSDHRALVYDDVGARMPSRIWASGSTVA